VAIPTAFLCPGSPPAAPQGRARRHRRYHKRAVLQCQAPAGLRELKLFPGEAWRGGAR